MRTHLFRGACAVAVVLTLAASAFAQSVVRGKVQDAQGKPVDRRDDRLRGRGHEPEDADEDRQQGRVPPGRSAVGRIPGDGVEGRRRHGHVQGHRPAGPEQSAHVHAGAGRSGGRAGRQGGGAEAAGAGGRGDGGAARRQQRRRDREVQRSDHARCRPARTATTTSASRRPTRRISPAAEASYKKAIELKPDNADAYTGLATLYNQQKKFDLAAEASANASKYHGGRRRRQRRGRVQPGRDPVQRAASSPRPRRSSRRPPRPTRTMRWRSISSA